MKFAPWAGELKGEGTFLGEKRADGGEKGRWGRKGEKGANWIVLSLGQGSPSGIHRPRIGDCYL